MKTIAWIENYLTQAEGLILENKVEEGLAILHDLLYDEPGYAILHNYLGWAYMYYAINEDRAEMHFNVAIRFAKEYAPPYLHMGTLLNRRGRYSEAIESFREGLTKPEANRTALLEGMGVAHEFKKEYRNAIRLYKEAATASVVDFEVDRMLNGVKRCRKKRVALFFTF